jgi:hypothetical protein
MPDQPQKYRVVALSGGETVSDLLIEGEPSNIHQVQPLGDEILLICARSRYKGPGDYDRNGRIYTRDGKFIRSILLGDDIRSVQSTSEGVIWACFFDEGIFGNFGWEDHVGAAGLVAWVWSRCFDCDRLRRREPARCRRNQMVRYYRITAMPAG